MMEAIRKQLRRWTSCPEASAYHVDSADGFRVICVLLVMWFHIWQKSWLSQAVRVAWRWSIMSAWGMTLSSRM